MGRLTVLPPVIDNKNARPAISGVIRSRHDDAEHLGAEAKTLQVGIALVPGGVGPS